MLILGRFSLSLLYHVEIGIFLSDSFSCSLACGGGDPGGSVFISFFWLVSFFVFRRVVFRLVECCFPDVSKRGFPSARYRDSESFLEDRPVLRLHVFLCADWPFLVSGTFGVLGYLWCFLGKLVFLLQVRII